MDKSAPILYRLSSVIVDRNRAYDEITFHQAARVIADTIGTIYSGIKTEAFQRALINKNILFGIGDFSIIGTDITKIAYTK